MLVVNIDIWPHGDANASRSITTILVANRQEGSLNRENYTAVYHEDNEWYECLVRGHNREEGCLSLLADVLAADAHPITSALAYRMLKRWFDQIDEEGVP